MTPKIPSAGWLWFAISFWSSAFVGAQTNGIIGFMTVMSTYSLIAAATYGVANMKGSGGSK